MRLEFDPVKLAQCPETVRLVSGVAPTHSGDGTQLRKPELAERVAAKLHSTGVYSCSLMSRKPLGLM
jgi:hypothetical protein